MSTPQYVSVRSQDIGDPNSDKYVTTNHCTYQINLNPLMDRHIFFTIDRSQKNDMNM